MNLDVFHPIVLNVGKAVCNSDWNWKNVRSPFARIYYIVAGKASVEVLGKHYKLLPGRLYMIPPFVSHSTHCEGTFVHYYLHVYEEENTWSGMFEEYDIPFEVTSELVQAGIFERLTTLHPTMSLQEFNPHAYDNEVVLRQRVIQHQEHSEWLRMESRAIVYLICSQFLAQATIKPFTRDERVLKAIHYMHANISRTVSNQELADVAGLSTGHFIRLFAEVTGMSPRLFINEKRIERAQMLLHSTDLTVKEIGQMLGFPDNSYFVRVFKRSTGTTPSEYRSQAV